MAFVHSVWNKMGRTDTLTSRFLYRLGPHLLCVLQILRALQNSGPFNPSYVIEILRKMMENQEGGDKVNHIHYEFLPER